MQQREKYLLAGLLGVLGFVVIYPRVEAVLLSPFTSKRAKVTELREQVESKSAKENRYLAAKRELQEWTAESLPPEPLNAQRVYAEWLVDLARLSGLRNIKPTLGNRSTVAGVYTSIPVTLAASGTLPEVAAFLFHFERTRLLQRVARCDLTSPETEGTPLLEVTFTAEGLALPTAEERTRLFPRSSLAAALTPEARELRVATVAGFPTQGGFRIRIDREFVNVTHQEGAVWHVERGASGTSAEAHAADAIIELAPEQFSADPQAPRTVAEYRRLLEAGPFVKPRPPVVYQPQLTPIANQTLLRGTPLIVQARVTGWDPADGPPVFLLSDDAPPGMHVDDDGRLTWSPGPDVPTGDYPASLAVVSAFRDDLQLTTSFRVTLRDPNLPPRITLPATLPTAWIGRQWQAQVTAVDPDGPGRLTYRLAGTPPAGAAIDAATGTLRWDVPETTEPGRTSLTIEVSDGGSPPQTATATLNVEVDDDVAQFTYLVGCIRDGDRWTAWLYDRSQNRSQYLQVGSEFRVADIRGQVVAIDLTSMEFQDQRGRWKLPPERPLRDAEPIAATAPAAGMPPPSLVAPGRSGDRPPPPELPRRTQ